MAFPGFVIALSLQILVREVSEKGDHSASKLLLSRPARQMALDISVAELRLRTRNEHIGLHKRQPRSTSPGFYGLAELSDSLPR